ncbi:MAG: serine/threonine protein kinase, partial [Myxococcales bacterium]|nr:serine/threonine protein kinase [Myxococcales bacterium]
MNTDEHGPSSSEGLGRAFLFRECVGRGGFGEVYRATMTLPSGVHQTVAVKILKKALDPFGQSVQRLRDEAHLLAALDHPALLRVYDLVLLEGRVGLVTEFVDGVDLLSLLKPQGGMSLRMFAEILADVASGLEAAWSTPGSDGVPLNLVHRDIKPANLRLSRHGQVKLLDFGIARANIEREATTTTDTIIGTYQYMSPERFNHESGPSADVFALGCVLLEGFTHRRLFQGLTLQKHFVTMASRDNYEPALAEELAGLPATATPRVRELLAQMLAFTPGGRPSAAEVAARLEQLSPALPGLPTRAWCRHHPFPEVGGTGDLTGRSIAEGSPEPRAVRRATLPPPDAPSSLRPPPDPVPEPVATVENPPSVETVELPSELAAARRRRNATTPIWVWVLLLGVLGVSAVVIMSLSAGVFVTRSVLDVTAAVSGPEPEPAPVTPVVPEPVPEPEPSEPAPPEPEPEPDPVPVETPPAPSTGLAVGEVVFDGRVPARLVSQEGRRYTASGPVPSGAYTIEADFGQGYVKAGRTVVSTGR